MGPARSGLGAAAERGQAPRLPRRAGLGVRLCVRGKRLGGGGHRSHHCLSTVPSRPALHRGSTSWGVFRTRHDALGELLPLIEVLLCTLCVHMYIHMYTHMCVCICIYGPGAKTFSPDGVFHECVTSPKLACFSAFSLHWSARVMRLQIIHLAVGKQLGNRKEF